MLQSHMLDAAREKPTLLVVEDEEAISTQLKWALSSDYTVLQAHDRPQALALMHQAQPAVVTLDLGLPPQSRQTEEGLRTLESLIAHDALTKVIVVTGQAEQANALRSLRHGAYDVLAKPIQLPELKTILSRAFYLAYLEREQRAAQLQGLRAAAIHDFEGMLGSSPAMLQVFAAITRVATTDASVLITGESGTGKEMVARALHRRSDRISQAFVAINCGAIPELLLESELFGHERGAFTGAHIARKGRIEAAHGGTLFLDEVSELPLPLQVKLLRFLQTHHIQRLGGREELPIDVRVLAATNANLDQRVAAGQFREDLYYRLRVVSLTLPPLREREDDIVLLAHAILRRWGTQYQRAVTGFTSPAITALKNHSWPGNVRELENRIQRAVIMADGSRVSPIELELSSRPGPYEGLTLKEAREAMERDMISNALARYHGNHTHAARYLGIGRRTLYDLIAKLGTAGT